MIRQLTKQQQDLAAENIRLTTELIKRNIGRNNLTYDEVYDASIEALISAAIHFKHDLGFKFSTLYFKVGDKAVKTKIRDSKAKKRSGRTVNFDLIEPLPYHENYSFFDRELINLAISNCGLSKKEKSCVFLYYYKQLSQPEIGKIMGHSQNHISRLLRRSIGKLREYILER